MWLSRIMIVIWYTTIAKRTLNQSNRSLQQQSRKRDQYSVRRLTRQALLITTPSFQFQPRHLQSFCTPSQSRRDKLLFKSTITKKQRSYSSHVVVGFTVLPNRIRSYWSSDNIEFLIIHICEAFFALNNDTFKQIMFVLWRIPICPTDDFNFLFLFMSPGWATVFKVRFTLKYLI